MVRLKNEKSAEHVPINDPVVSHDASQAWLVIRALEELLWRSQFKHQ